MRFLRETILLGITLFERPHLFSKKKSLQKILWRCKRCFGSPPDFQSQGNLSLTFCNWLRSVHHRVFSQKVIIFFRIVFFIISFPSLWKWMVHKTCKWVAVFLTQHMNDPFNCWGSGVKSEVNWTVNQLLFYIILVGWLVFHLYLFINNPFSVKVYLKQIVTHMLILFRTYKHRLYWEDKIYSLKQFNVPIVGIIASEEHLFDSIMG